MKYTFDKLVIIISLMILPNFSWSGVSQGQIYYITIHEPDVLMFDTGPIYGSPSCNTVDQWAIRMNTVLGKAMLATLLSAQAQGKEVFVQGYSNTCGAWGDRELPSYIALID